jgi:hypothetical protein
MIWKTKNHPEIVMRHHVRGYIAESRLASGGMSFQYTLTTPDGLIVRQSLSEERDRIIELHMNLTASFCFMNGLSTTDIEDA